MQPETGGILRIHEQVTLPNGFAVRSKSPRLSGLGVMAYFSLHEFGNDQ